MAVYSPEQLNIKAPTGGFQQGGWYSGRQYWGGTLSEPGVIHPSSAQIGAGQAVSPEVIAQTSPANVPYIQQLQAQAPRSAEEVTPFLNQFQSDLFQATERPQVRVPTMEELQTTLAPKTAYPEPLKRVEKFEELRATYKVADLEESLNAIKDQIRAEQDTLRKARGIEEGKPVPMNVIAGRVGEQERAAQERIDALGREQSRLVDQLNTKYNLISTYMNFYGLDYQDSVKRYDDEFDRNVKFYEIINKKEIQALEAWQKDRAFAQSNLEIFVNAISSGNLTYSGMSADQKLMVAKLEAQSGLPVGFVSNLQMSAKQRLLSVNEKTGEALIVGDDGKMKVVQTGMRASGTTSAAKNISQQFSQVATFTSKKNFPDLVEQFATVMSLEEIYQAYMNSELGKQYGKPVEDPRVIQLTYKVARGEITEEEARKTL